MDKYRFMLRERLAGFRDWIDGRNVRAFELVILVILVVGLTAIVSSAYLPQVYGFRQGEPAPRDVVAAKTVTAYDVAATQDLKRQVSDLVEPVYYADPGVLTTSTQEVSAFFVRVGELRQGLPLIPAEGQGTGDITTTSTLSSTTAFPGLSLAEAHAKLRQFAPSSVSDATLDFLLSAPSDLYDQMEQQILTALRTVYSGRVTEGSLADARARLRTVTNALALSSDTRSAVFDLAEAYLRPNQIIDEEQTEVRRKAAADEVAPVMITVRKGERVIREGEIVTVRDAMVLDSLGLAETRAGVDVWLGVFLLVLMEMFVLYRLLARFNKVERLPNNLFLAVAVLLLAFTGLARALIIAPSSAYVVPVAALGMTTAIILNARSGLLSVVLLSLNLGIMTDLDLGYTVVALLSGGISLYLVSKVGQRSALLLAGLKVMIAAALAVFAVEIFREASPGQALLSSVWGLVNGFGSGMLAVVLLLILDTAFNLTTPLRLLELENPAQPLLRRLMQVAPGTYNHSILMGNLAAAAAESIGGDPLLARVGAYYHDIGKTVRPEYFVENQIYTDNPHDHMSPNLSKLAITAHVRDGEHLAKLYGLPRPVVDIIKQHHGTSVVSYFLHKAQEGAGETVDAESYRYEEQRPTSKEAGIVMLADAVEAGVRAMRNPTRRKIQGLIQEIVKQRMEDGQLDESGLTLGDLHRISEAFDIGLRGLVGHRIRYPDENGHAQPSGARSGSRRGAPAAQAGTVAAEAPTSSAWIGPLSDSAIAMLPPSARSAIARREQEGHSDGRPTEERP